MRKHMKTLIFIMAALTLVLAACGGGATDAPAAPTDAASDGGSSDDHDGRSKALVRYLRSRQPLMRRKPFSPPTARRPAMPIGRKV